MTKKVRGKVVASAKTTTGQNVDILDNGKVRVLKDFSDLKGLIPGVMEDSNRFMNTLYNALRDNLGSDKVSRKNVKQGGDKIVVVEAMDYRLQFDEEGFCIKDKQDYFNKVDSWDIPFPTVKEVLNWLTRPKTVPKKNVEYIDPTKSILNKKRRIEERYNVVLLDKGKSLVEPLQEEAPVAKVWTLDDYENQRKKLLKNIKNIDNPIKLINKLEDKIEHRGFKILFNKLKKRLEHKEIRSPRFVKEAKNLLETISFEEKKKPAGKFVGLNFWNITELHYETSGVEIVVNGQRYQTTETEILARFVIHKDPKVMPQLMKFIDGSITKEEFLKEPIKRDRFQGFEYNKIKTDSIELKEVCEELLLEWQIQNPLDVVYSNEVQLQKGDKVRVEFINYFTKFYGTVVNLHNGIEIRYEDGEVLQLHKRQLWQKEAEKLK